MDSPGSECGIRNLEPLDSKILNLSDSKLRYTAMTLSEKHDASLFPILFNHEHSRKILAVWHVCGTAERVSEHFELEFGATCGSHSDEALPLFELAVQICFAVSALLLGTLLLSHTAGPFSISGFQGLLRAILWVGLWICLVYAQNHDHWKPNTPTGRHLIQPLRGSGKPSLDATYSTHTALACSKNSAAQSQDV